jgi:hypothetical protein
VRGFKRPPKYSCSTCGRLFKSRKIKDDHVLFNRCRGLKNKNKVTLLAEPADPELAEMKTHNYVGREYNGNPIPTGNRHLRTGIPLPRISQYDRAAI